MSHTPWRTVQRQWALHQGGNNTWYRIRNQIDGPTQLHIYDEIGYFGVSAKDLIRDLADVNGPLELHLNSPGGEVHEGIAIYNTLLGRHDVTVMIDGIAASIASVIAMAGNPVLIARTAQMMVHDGYAMAIGSAQDFRDQAEVLDKASNLIAGVYADHTGKPPAYWRQVMKAETWYDAQEAIDSGLADRFIPSSNVRHTTDHRRDERWDLSAAFRGPSDLRGAAAHPYVDRNSPLHEPITGMHAHNHAAFGADDHDDGMHHHSHYHDGHATHTHDHTNHGHDHQHEHPHVHAHEAHMNDYGSHDHDHVHHAGYETHASGDGIQQPPLTDRPMNRVLNWDGAAAMASAHSAADFRKICAGERNSGDPDTAAHWALPHHTSPSSGPDKGGVSAALGRWNQTQGLKNKDAALAHLRAHARTLGLPSGDESENHLDLSDEDIARFTQGIKL